MPEAKPYRFDRFTLDMRARWLRRGDSIAPSLDELLQSQGSGVQAEEAHHQGGQHQERDQGVDPVALSGESQDREGHPGHRGRTRANRAVVVTGKGKFTVRAIPPR